MRNVLSSLRGALGAATWRDIDDYDPKKGWQRDIYKRALQSAYLLGRTGKVHSTGVYWIPEIRYKDELVEISFTVKSHHSLPYRPGNVIDPIDGVPHDLIKDFSGPWFEFVSSFRTERAGRIESMQSLVENLTVTVVPLGAIVLRGRGSGWRDSFKWDASEYEASWNFRVGAWIDHIVERVPMHLKGMEEWTKEMRHFTAMEEERKRDRAREHTAEKNRLRNLR